MQTFIDIIDRLPDDHLAEYARLILKKRLFDEAHGRFETDLLREINAQAQNQAPRTIKLAPTLDASTPSPLSQGTSDES